MKIKNQFKSGAASFYIVAFSTLILVIIAASFASAIVAEITRSSNDDLSQSAYDAALAGAEDAKLAFSNYWNCISNGVINEVAPDGDGNISCGEIVWWMNHYEVTSGADSGCNMVGHIIGRLGETASGEVAVNESGDNEMDQAYTCTIINTKLMDYRATLSSAETYRVISPEFDEGKSANDVAYVKLSWYLNEEDSQYNYGNIVGDSVAFPSLNSAAVPMPPVMELQLIQTKNNFSLSELNGKSSGSSTDRAAVYLVPTSNTSIASETGDTYVGIYKTAAVFEGAGQRTMTTNLLSQSQMSSTNDHSKDLPYTVYCSRDNGEEYACSTMVRLPDPVGGARNDDTFTLIVSLPYGQPETDFALEFYDKNGNQLTLGRTQIAIDSTGRANDLYRRVEVRMEPADNSLEYPFYAVQLGDGEGGKALDKTLTAKTEWSAAQYPSYNNY